MFESVLPNEIEMFIYKKLHSMYMKDIRKEIKYSVVMFKSGRFFILN